MTKRAELRQRMNKEFALDEDIDAFLIDYFNEVWKSISRGMSRKEKINHLFSSKDESEIEQLLNAARPDAVKMPTSQAGIGQSHEGSLRLRQEIDRLRHVIRDLEQEAKSQGSKPSISTRNGLQRIQNGIKEFDRFYNDSQNTVEQQWLTYLHVSLDGLESALGRYHDIPCEFRYRSTIERQPISPDYRSLLCAAEDILKQRIEENDRASQNYVTNYLTLAAGLGGPARRF